MRWSIVVVIFGLFACASKNNGLTPLQLSQLPPPPYSQSLFSETQPDVESISDIFKLSDDQKSNFYNYFNAAKHRKFYPNKRIANYLNNKLSGFNFYSDTLTASQSLSNRLGNCLSLAIVTHSLAQLVGVKVEYELIETIPIYQREGDVILASQHVQTLLYDPGPGEFDGQIPLWRGYIRVDYYPVKGSKPLRKVKHPEFIMMFYLNRAAEAIVQQDYALAYAYLTVVLQNNKVEGQALNMMAIVHNRMGLPEFAESLYQYGLQYGLERDRYELLYNYHLLLKAQQKFAQAKVVYDELRMYPDHNPFRWISKGEVALTNHEYDRAIWYFRKAADIADYLYEPYVGIARAKMALGNRNGALKALEMVMEKAQKSSVKNLYRLKYRQLTDYQ